MNFHGVIYQTEPWHFEKDDGKGPRLKISFHLSNSSNRFHTVNANPYFIALTCFSEPYKLWTFKFVSFRVLEPSNKLDKSFHSEELCNFEVMISLWRFAARWLSRYSAGPNSKPVRTLCEGQIENKRSVCDLLECFQIESLFATRNTNFSFSNLTFHVYG